MEIKFFNNYVKNIALSSVLTAEEQFGSGLGLEKKEFAVEYVLSLLPIPGFIKFLAKDFLLKLVDEAIEQGLARIKAAL